jgi:hypothetical protein
VPGLQQPGFGENLVVEGANQSAVALDTSQHDDRTFFGGMVADELAGGVSVVGPDDGEPDHGEKVVGWFALV